MAHSVLSFYSSTTTRLTTLFESNTGPDCFGSDETKTTLKFFSPYQKGEGKSIPISFLNFYTQLYEMKFMFDDPFKSLDLSTAIARSASF